MTRQAMSAVMLGAALTLTGCASTHHADEHGHARGPVADSVIAQQRAALEANTRAKGFGPQAPRDIDSSTGTNTVAFTLAPPAAQMNLCNIHFHQNAEHKGGEFTTYAGNGDGDGNGTGYKYNGKLAAAELAPVGRKVCASSHGELQPGDTIEVHYVFSTAAVGPGPTLGACLNDATKNPQLRVEAQTLVLVNDKSALDFARLAQFGDVNGLKQAAGIPSNTGTPVQYAGSTTGPAYNESGSPFQVTWSVRPKVAKVNIETVASWCEGNVFKENHAHGARSLVVAPQLLAPMQR
jgi:Delta carbonic anhydrase